MSPVVSYQYFDWPGDENLTFQFTPQVSYYFGGGVSLALTGIVKDSTGIPIPGAEVILQRHNTVFWQGMTNAEGSLPASTLPAGNFNVVVIKPGYISLFQSVPGDAGGPLFLDLTLRSTFVLPDLVTVTRTPLETAIRVLDDAPVQGVRAANLRVFSGGAFSATAPILNDRMTIVITHGWLSNLDDWPTLMAGYILTNHSLGANPPNIVGWDWRNKAKGFRPPIDEACIQGEHLGKSLYLELGSNYSQRVHFVGHSLGTIVNSYACDYIHGATSRGGNTPPTPWDRNLTKPHVTVLDEAEITSVGGQSTLTAASLAWEAHQRKSLLMLKSAVDAFDWKNAVPNSAWWTDNYISLVGRRHENAVNICLPSVAENYYYQSGIAGLVEAHGYAHLWYRNSILASGVFPQIGFRQSYEKATSFPPTGTGKTLGNLWYEDTTTSELLDLKLETDPSLYDRRAEILGSLVLSTTATTPGNIILDSYTTGLSMVGDLGGEVIVKTGQVVVTVGEKIGNLWDAALDKVSTVNPDTLFAGSIGSSSLKLLLSTPAQSAQLRRTTGLNSSAVVSPPQAWMPVHVPAEAGFLVFDFTVTGQPASDLIACAVNEQNLFTLPARFAPDGSPVSTDFLDISAYAGQEVELYFGLVGGTSSGCTLAIDGIRFVTIPIPKLAATMVGDQVRLQWAAAATGWIPQHNPGLMPEGWQDVPLPEAITAVDGVVTLERPRLPTKEFFRLRRVE